VIPSTLSCSIRNVTVVPGCSAMRTSSDSRAMSVETRLTAGRHDEATVRAVMVTPPGGVAGTWYEPV
jgi:hypothetical protein